MRKPFMFILLAALLLLGACQPAVPTQTPAPPVEPGYPAPNDPGESTMDGYPAPGQGGEFLFNAYPPAPDDARLQRGNFFFETATLLPSSSTPGAVDLYVEGTLPTPCNNLRVQIDPPDANNRILVEVYSVSDPDMMCTQQIVPFAGHVATLSGYPSGTYQVVIEDQTIGELTVP